jgi:PAS domain S-box-containing protein
MGEDIQKRADELGKNTGGPGIQSEENPQNADDTSLCAPGETSATDRELFKLKEELIEAKEALRKSDELILIAKEAAQLGIYDYNLVTGTIQWDPRIREIWGIGPDIPVTIDAFMSGVHPDYRASVQSIFDRSLDPKGNGQFYAEHPVINLSNGIERWVASTGHVFFEGDRPVRLVGTVQDITERKHIEANLAFIAQVDEDFATLSSPDEVIQAAGSRIFGYFKVSCRITLFELDEARDEIRVLYDHHVPEVPDATGDLLLRQYLSPDLLQELKAGRAIAVEDMRTDPRTAPNANTQISCSIGSALIMPFLANRGRTFVIAIQHNKPHAWIADEVDLMRELAEKVFWRLERAYAYEALMESENKFRTIVETAGEGIIIIKPDEGSYIYVNKRMADLLGSQVNEIVGTSWSDFISVENRDRIIEARKELHKGNKTHGEFKFHRKDGLAVWTIYTATPIFDEKGGHVANIYMFTDITDRNQAEEALIRAKDALEASEKRFELQSEANALLLSSKDPEAVIQTIAEKVMQNLNCDVFFNYVFDESQGKLHLNAYSGISTEVAKQIEWLNKGDAICGCVAAEGHPIVSEDVLYNGDRRADLVRSMGIQAYVCQPLHVDEETIGTLSFGTKNKKSFTQDELTLIHTLADQVSIAIERKRAEETLQKSEELLRTVIENSRDGINMLDLRTGRYILMSPSQVALTGFTAEEINNISAEEAYDRVYPADRKISVAQQKLIASGYDTPYAVEYRWKVKSGEYRWFSDSRKLVRDSEGRPIAMVGISRDITEHKRAEEALRRSEERQAFLLRLSDSLRQKTDLQAIKKAASELLGLHFGIDAAGYVEVEPNGETIFIEGEYNNGQAPSQNGWHRISDYGEGFRDMLLSGKEINIENFPADKRGHNLGPLAPNAIGIGAIASTPIMKDGRLVDYFYAIYHLPYTWTEEERLILRETAERTWVAVERAKSEGALRKSEEKYRTLFNSIDEGFCIIEVIFDQDGKAVDYRFLEANPSFEKQTGLTNVKGKRVKELIPKHDAHWFEAYGNVALTGEPARFENRASELHRWYEVYAFRYGLPEDRQVAVLFNDITERKQVEEKLLRQNKVLEGINKIFHEAITCQTAEELGLVCLMVAEDLTDSEIGLIGEIHKDGNMYDLVIDNPGWDLCEMYDKTGHRKPPGDFKIHGLYGYVIEHGESLLTNEPASHKDSIGLPEGHTPLTSFLGVPLLDDGKVIGLIGVGNRKGGYLPEHQEILEALAPAIVQALLRKRAEEELRKTRNELEIRVKERTEELVKAKDMALEALEAKAAFLANISHELRTPMNAVIGFSSLLLDEPLTAEQKDQVERIRAAGEVLLVLINDILDLSKVERHKVELEHQPLNLKNLVEESLGMVAVQAKEKGLKLTHTISYGTPEVIIGDPGRLMQILTNLLGNAVKFTDQGYISLSVSSKALDEKKQQILFEIMDIGIGIPPEQMNKLFLPFSQVEKALSSQRGGTGLGLAISKRLVELMGGEIWAESSPGLGSKFSFTIEAEIGKGELLVPEKSASIKSAYENLAEKNPLRILVAEDNPSNLKVLIQMLKKMGYRADVAVNGREVLHALERQPYDLVLMDVMMPDMDGLEATREIRERWHDKGPKIVAITAYAQEGDRENCIKAGMDDYIAKPINMDDLAKILHEIATKE